MRNFKDEIEEARAKVAHCRIRAERPGSRLEDDFALEKARNRLLTLELRQLKLAGSVGHERRADTPRSQRSRSGERMISRTKRDQKFSAPREKAEKLFASLNQTRADKEGAE